MSALLDAAEEGALPLHELARATLFIYNIGTALKFIPDFFEKNF